MAEKSEKFNFWNDHSRAFLAAACDYERHGTMADADCVADQTGDCGDSVKIYLKLDGEKEKIVRMQFEVKGCRNTNACCNALAGLAEGRRHGRLPRMPWQRLWRPCQRTTFTVLSSPWGVFTTPSGVKKNKEPSRKTGRLFISGDLETACISFIFEAQKRIYRSITLLSAYSVYLDVSFLALSEDKFFTSNEEDGRLFSVPFCL